MTMPRLLVTAACLVGAGLLAFAALAWHLASVLERDALRAHRRPPRRTLEVVAINESSVTVRGDDPDLRIDGIFGLETEHGHARVSDILAVDGDAVTRRLETLTGAIEPGDMARIENFAYAGHPVAAHGLDFEDIVYEAEHGHLPAWLIGRERPAWVLFVHGKGAGPVEALRVLPLIDSLGMGAMCISYRNDLDAFPDPAGRYGYGATEWRDLDSAIAFARAEGAGDIVLYGFSMGAGIILRWLRERGSEGIAGIVLDAPMLSFAGAVEHQARHLRVPQPLVTAGKAVARLRFGVQWHDLDYRADAEAVDVPVLVFHGGADRDVPAALSRALAEGRPEFVRYVEVEGAGHVRAWNVARERYESTLRDFLLEVVDP